MAPQFSLPVTFDSLIKYLQNGVMFWLYSLYDNLASWSKPIEILITDGFCDSLQVSLQVKLVLIIFGNQVQPVDYNLHHILVIKPYLYLQAKLGILKFLTSGLVAAEDNFALLIIANSDTKSRWCYMLGCFVISNIKFWYFILFVLVILLLCSTVLFMIYSSVADSAAHALKRFSR